MAEVEIERVDIAAARGSLQALETFYGDRLGMRVAARDDSNVQLRVGHSTVHFRQTTGAGRPFYHFAFLAPGNRFDAAYAWLAERAEILPHRDSEGTVFEFEFIDAHACYFHDPADNIVELIAHRGISESGVESDAAFSADELVGISEIGVVTPHKTAAAESLDDSLGLRVWQGELDTPDDLAFLGRQAHTVILSSPGRGWLPTGRAAEVHPVNVVLNGTKVGRAELSEAVSLPEF